MILGQPFLKRRWQQQLLIRIVGTEGLAHQRIPMLEVSPIITSAPHHRRFSDGLLEPCKIQAGVCCVMTTGTSKKRSEEIAEEIDLSVRRKPRSAGRP